MIILSIFCNKRYTRLLKKLHCDKLKTKPILFIMYIVEVRSETTKEVVIGTNEVHVRIQGVPFN